MNGRHPKPQPITFSGIVTTASRFARFLTLMICLAMSLVPQAKAQDSNFQQQLDRHGVEYRIPPTGKAILVNIPAFELIAFDNGKPVLRSRFIVGAPWTPTPIMETETTKVRFRPTWRPTPSMVRSGDYADRLWPPGENNPLGLAAIRLEEGLLVYLHDTNRRDLFERPDRALSHGCIRVEKWDVLIAWLLDMPLAQMHRLANGNRTIDIETPPVPVTLAYLRRFIDSDGRVQCHADIYARQPGAC